MDEAVKMPSGESAAELEEFYRMLGPDLVAAEVMEEARGSAEKPAEETAKVSEAKAAAAERREPGARLPENIAARKQPGNRLVQKAPPKHKVLDFLSDVVIWVLVIGAALVARERIMGADRPTAFFGYTLSIVETGSMQKEIPIGSLVVSQMVDPATLELGDDITFLPQGAGKTWTHRIVGIGDDPQTGELVFRTKGIMNNYTDENPVPAANVVGLVVFHSLNAGKAIQLVQKHWVIMLFWSIVAVILMKFLAHIWKNDAQ